MSTMPGFAYRRVEHLDEALEALALHGPVARPLAGGHSLLPLMKQRRVAPALLLDISGLAELRGVRREGDELVIGALTSYRALATSDLLRREAPLLALAAAEVGDRQVQHRGTLGGILAHADPAADLPAALLALDAELLLHGPAGSRRLPLAEFVRGPQQTALDQAELITELRLAPDPGPAVYLKLRRRALDWATVAVAAAGRPGGVRLALAAMGPAPLRPRAAERALASGASATEAAALADAEAEPESDLAASGAVRRHLARVLTRRALEQLAQEARP